ncbi:unknown [[Mannheimia] succiniciproducens MBEL55E]|uniref:Uncharacterized protein n=1 Tax=Mannheimia succiniciproducens (strain KCTC 0769BP / MBEL55E) TaxID=221988 RepID=Q65SL8_MANSM|nr:unknown [[Mannheimia] succiniciproducens MBEL55E]
MNPLRQNVDKTEKCGGNFENFYRTLGFVISIAICDN